MPVDCECGIIARWRCTICDAAVCETHGSNVPGVGKVCRAHRAVCFYCEGSASRACEICQQKICDLHSHAVGWAYDPGDPNLIHQTEAIAWQCLACWDKRRLAHVRIDKMDAASLAEVLTSHFRTSETPLTRADIDLYLYLRSGRWRRAKGLHRLCTVPVWKVATCSESFQPPGDSNLEWFDTSLWLTTKGIWIFNSWTITVHDLDPTLCDALIRCHDEACLARLADSPAVSQLVTRDFALSYSDNRSGLVSEARALAKKITTNF